MRSHALLRSLASCISLSTENLYNSITCKFGDLLDVFCVFKNILEKIYKISSKNILQKQTKKIRN